MSVLIFQMPYINKSEIPIKVIIAPSISFLYTFSLKTIIDKGIISIGVMEVMVETIPVGAC